MSVKWEGGRGGGAWNKVICPLYGIGVVHAMEYSPFHNYLPFYSGHVH